MSEQSPLTPDVRARHRGRMGMAIPWENIPWWAIIILIVGVIVGFSIFTNAYYRDALYFIFDFPWNRQAVATIKEKKIGPNGEWTYTFTKPLEPGKYTLYGEYFNEQGESIGRSDVYIVQVPSEAEAVETESMKPSEEVIVLETSTPTLSGVAPPGTVEVRIIDDFRDQPLRVARRIWIANGVVMTLKVTLIAFSLALVLGLIFGLMRVSSRSPNLFIGAPKRLLIGLLIAAALIYWREEWREPKAIIAVLAVTESTLFLLPALPYTISTLYVEIIRGVPMLVIILYMGFAITPALRDATGGNVDLRGLPAAVLGLGFGYGAYLAEVFRAGIESIPKGQMEAARSLGMTYMQAMRLVILPQAIRLILPPLGNDFIAMLKDSSLISVIALPEVLQQGRLWISRNFRAFEGYNSVMMVYLVLTLSLSLLVRAIERRSRLPSK